MAFSTTGSVVELRAAFEEIERTLSQEREQRAGRFFRHEELLTAATAAAYKAPTRANLDAVAAFLQVAPVVNSMLALYANVETSRRIELVAPLAEPLREAAEAREEELLQRRRAIEREDEIRSQEIGEPQESTALLREIDRRLHYIVQAKALLGRGETLAARGPIGLAYDSHF